MRTAATIEREGGLHYAYARLRPDLTVWEISDEIDSLRHLLSYVVELGHPGPARKYARALAGMGLAVLGR